ncbi:hypothetical protein PtA15_9A687 [Puccinia triticina]|uniref:Uncharacterized protein n=1 Tax=Puccinia triticina TaxID=208348 RepID=A0ABY7CV78_9BASI|nr:uncharacterized protein PtA15_9A687 [Puccinia triticina]WAQ88560.1 hypothetical protein PtA15_9A687 [Puccinia triticina]
MHHSFIQTGEYLSPCKCLAPVSPPPSPWQPAQLCPLTNSRFSHCHSASTSSTFPSCGLPQTPTAKCSLPRRPHLQTRECLTFYNPAPAGPLNCSKSMAGCRPATPSCSSRPTCQGSLSGFSPGRPPWAPASSRGTPSASLADLARPKTLFATHSAGKRVFKPVACSKGWLEDGEPGSCDDSFLDCVEIVDHGQQLLAHSLNNAFPGEQGQPVFQRDANKPIVLNPLANTIKAKQTLHLLLRINCSG